MEAKQDKTQIKYEISSRAYLSRARENLKLATSESYFYAALELRCGIEARMAEYLEAWDHISKSKKNGWRIADLARNIENEFKIGEKTIQVGIQDYNTRKLIVSFYYTPVSSKLKKIGEKLGNYLHALKDVRYPNSTYWVEFREELEEGADQLQIANTGTLLGPLLVNATTKITTMMTENPPGTNKESILEHISLKNKYLVNIQHLDKLPQPIEPEAQIWKKF